MVADQPLLDQPLEAGFVHVELEWLLAEGTQRVHHSQELKTVGGVAVFLDGEFALLKSHQVPGPLVVRLLQNGAHCKLRGVGDEPRGP